MKRHVALVALAEVLHDFGGRLVRLCEQDAVRVGRLDLGAHAFEERVRLGQVLAVGALTREQVGHCVEPQPVEPELQPEADHVEHRLLDLGVVVVEVRLVVEEAMPVVGARDRVPRPVGGLGVDEDDPRIRVALVCVRPHVPVALGRVRAGAGLLEPRMVAGGVVDDHVRDHAHAALVGGVDEAAHVFDRAVVRVHRVEVGDVVAAVAQRRGVHRQQPDAVHAEPLQVLEPLRQAAEVARAVGVCVREAAQVDLVEDGPLEPQRVGLEPVRRRRHGRRTRITCATRVPGSRRT